VLFTLMRFDRVEQEQQGHEQRQRVHHADRDGSRRREDERPERPSATAVALMV
jgi:hypothetical protein